jgi:SAM-dependent methyltransferase
MVSGNRRGKRSKQESPPKEAFDAAADLKTRIQIQERHRTNPLNWFQWVFERLGLPEKCRILELGCGLGDLWLQNLDRLPAGWQMMLSDLSAGMLQAVRRSPLAQLSQFTFYIMDAQAIPFPQESFEAVFGLGLLDLVPGRKRTLEEIWRVLKPGGSLYASAGGFGHLQEIEDRVRPLLPEADYGGNARRFGLENGISFLSNWFQEIRLERYPDELVFDNPEPILAYALSEPHYRAGLSGEKLEQFRKSLEKEFSRHGEFRITSAKGLFRAIKS